MPSQPTFYSSLDRPLIDSPLEEQSETAWAEFQDLMSQPQSPPPAVTRIKPMRVTLHVLFQYCELHGRICPTPTEWMAFYSLIEDLADGSTEIPPPPPVSTLSWSTISPRTKRMCFHAHIEWFQQHNLLESAADFLVNLQESQWLHMEA